MSTLSSFDAITRAIGASVTLQRYWDQRHYAEARTPGLVVSRLMERDPDFAEAVRNLKSDDLAPSVIRRDDAALGGFGTVDSDAARFREAAADFDRKLSRRRR